MNDNYLQNTPEWYGARLYHFTSSELHKLMTRPKAGAGFSKTAEEYIFDKLAEELTGGTCLEHTQADTRATRWGHTYEPEARTRYEAATGRTVDLCGFFEWSPSFGGSPDGLVGDDGIIEIKCPYSSAVHARYLMLQSADELRKLRPEYYAQIQGNLLVTGRRWADFVSFDPRCQNEAFTLKVLRVGRDEEFIAAAREAIEAAAAKKNEYITRILENIE